MSPATFASQLVRKTVKIHIALATWRERLFVYGANRTTSECARRLCIAIYNAGIRLSRLLQGTAPEAAESVCDILNAGPRHRFATAASLVSNCGYGAGAPKVKIIAATMVGVELTDDESEVLVTKFRSREFIPGLWRTLETGMRMSRASGIFRMSVPNGGEMVYRDVQAFGRNLSAVIPRQGRFMRLKYWGGVLTENLVQRVARDVFMDTVLRLEAAGLPPILRVHDEAVCLVPNATAEADLARMTKIMSTRPTWMPDLPLRAEGHLCQRYAKG